jgi:hypothetical protein
MEDGSMDLIRLDTDMWDDAGKTYKVIEYYRRPESTAVELKLEDIHGNKYDRVVAFHQIEWLDDREV